MNTDEVNIGYGGTLSTGSLHQGVPGMWVSLVVWDWKDRADQITLRELRAIKRLLSGWLGRRIEYEGAKGLFLHAENQAVVHITKRFVSKSR